MPTFTVKYLVEVEYETLDLDAEVDPYVDTTELKDCLQNAIEHCRQESMLTDLYDISCNWANTETLKVDR